MERLFYKLLLGAITSMWSREYNKVWQREADIRKTIKTGELNDIYVLGKKDAFKEVMDLLDLDEVDVK